MLDHDSAEGRYARSVLVSTLAYAVALVPEIADDPDAVDRALCLGYNWKFGPFALIDQLGPAWLSEALEKDGHAVPPLLAATLAVVAPMFDAGSVWADYDDDWADGSINHCLGHRLHSLL